MVVGMVLAGLAFVVAGFVQLKLQSSLQALNAGESRLSIYNNALPSVSYHIEGFEATILNNGEVSLLIRVYVLRKNLTASLMSCN